MILITLVELWFSIRTTLVLCTSDGCYLTRSHQLQPKFISLALCSCHSSATLKYAQPADFTHKERDEHMRHSTAIAAHSNTMHQQQCNAEKGKNDFSVERWANVHESHGNGFRAVVCLRLHGCSWQCVAVSRRIERCWTWFGKAEHGQQTNGVYISREKLARVGHTTLWPSDQLSFA